MPIVTVCPNCQARFTAPDKALGKRVPCGKCRQPFVVAIAEAPAPGSSSVAKANLVSPVERQSPPAAGKSPVKSSTASPASAARPPASGANVSPSAPKAAQRSPLSEAEIAAAFVGAMPRARTALAYQFGLLLALIVMVSLVLVYLGLIAAACFAVYYHFTHHSGMLGVHVGGRAKVIVLIIYLAPAVIGPLLIFFLFKPLLARPARQERTRSLTRSSEPLLFAFVDQVCQAVGAPKPKRIDVDCEVNASASFRRGLLSFLGRDLVLTVGLPLLAGLTLREFGGVLAHEFGHFAQGAGMRMTYLVRSISHWFMRVVYERDQWDEWLENTAQEVDFRIGWVLLAAHLGVWISRGVLWILMHVGMAVAGLLLRQMEFDADRYETRFAGAESFAATSRKLRLLGMSSQLASVQLLERLSERQLVDDLPALVVLNVRNMPAELVAKIDQDVATQSTGWFDTHPCDRDRIARSQRTGGEGVFRSARPARDLLADYGAQAKATTWDQYMGWFGPRVPRDALVPATEFARHCKSTWK